MPPGPTPFCAVPEGVPSEWTDVCGFVKPPRSQSEWLVRKHGVFEIIDLHFGSVVRRPDLPPRSLDPSQPASVRHWLNDHGSHDTANETLSQQPVKKRQELELSMRRCDFSYNLAPERFGWKIRCVTGSSWSEPIEFSRLASGRITCTRRAFCDGSMFCVSFLTCSHPSLLHCDSFARTSTNFHVRVLCFLSPWWDWLRWYMCLEGAGHAQR